MTEQSSASVASVSGQSPGALLRAARERRGMHIATLAAAIKVAPARLEALEADDYGRMPDLTFARALAQAVCRALKVDPAPVLALMPESMHSRLERVDEGLNAPFRQRGGRLVEASDGAVWRYPVVGVALALLVAAAAFLWWPKTGPSPDPLPPGAEPMVSAPGPVATDAAAPAGLAPGGASTAPVAVATEALPSATAVVSTAPVDVSQSAAPTLPILGANAAPAAAAANAGSAAPPAATGEGAVLRAVQDTWVQVSDGTGKVLAARTFSAGESVPFSGPLPLRLRIGNVQGTELVFQGRPVDLRAMTKDNTLSLSLPLAAAPSAGATAAGATPTPLPKPALPAASRP